MPTAQHIRYLVTEYQSEAQLLHFPPSSPLVAWETWEGGPEPWDSASAWEAPKNQEEFQSKPKNCRHRI